MGVKVIKIGASWCQPCKVVEKIIYSLSSKLPNIEFLHYDIDGDVNECVKHDVTQVPTILILKNDVEKERINYVISEPELKRKIENVI